MWKICLAKPTLTRILFIIALIVLSNGVREPHDANTKIRTQLQHIVGKKITGQPPVRGLRDGRLRGFVESGNCFVNARSCFAEPRNRLVESQDHEGLRPTRPPLPTQRRQVTT